MHLVQTGSNLVQLSKYQHLANLNCAQCYTLIAEDEILEGIYYNNDDTSSLLTADSLVKDSQGGYVLNMLRGGGMLVDLKIHKHTPRAAVSESAVAATCTSEGSKDSVVYCSECGAELSRTKVAVPATGHQPGAATMENYAEPTAAVRGGYDNVVRCTICGVTLSSEHVDLGYAEAPKPVPAPEPWCRLCHIFWLLLPEQ